MTEDEKAALEEVLMLLTKEAAALRDVLAIICVHLAHLPAAADLAQQLRATADANALRPSANFSALARQLADALEQKPDLVLPSFGSPPPRLDREELRRLLRVLPGGPGTA